MSSETVPGGTGAEYYSRIHTPCVVPMVRLYHFQMNVLS
jgi:hypothetical protein